MSQNFTIKQTRSAMQSTVIRAAT